MTKTNKRKEEWRPLPGFEGGYEISSYGRVISHRHKAGTTILSPYFNPSRKYYYISVQMPDRKRRNLILHRLVAQAFIPRVEGKPLVNHIDADRKNNNVSNLEWCTYQENTDHAKALGLIPAYNYRLNPRVLLTPDLARQIVAKAREKKLSYTQVAALFGVKYSTVAHIMTGRQWANATNIKT